MYTTVFEYAQSIGNMPNQLVIYLKKYQATNSSIYLVSSIFLVKSILLTFCVEEELLIKVTRLCFHRNENANLEHNRAFLPYNQDFKTNKYTQTYPLKQSEAHSSPQEQQPAFDAIFEQRRRVSSITFTLLNSNVSATSNLVKRAFLNSFALLASRARNDFALVIIVFNFLIFSLYGFPNPACSMIFCKYSLLNTLYRHYDANHIYGLYTDLTFFEKNCNNISTNMKFSPLHAVV